MHPSYLILIYWKALSVAQATQCQTIQVVGDAGLEGMWEGSDMDWCCPDIRLTRSESDLENCRVSRSRFEPCTSGIQARRRLDCWNSLQTMKQLANQRYVSVCDGSSRSCNQTRADVGVGCHRSLCKFNLLKPTGHVMHQQFNIQQLWALPTLYLCVLYLSENKQRIVPLTA